MLSVQIQPIEMIIDQNFRTTEPILLIFITLGGVEVEVQIGDKHSLVHSSDYPYQPK